MIEPAEISVVLATDAMRQELGTTRYALIGVNADSGISYSRAYRRRFSNVLKEAELVTARDPLSAGVIRDLEPSADVAVTGDVVLCLRPADEAPQAAASVEGRFIAVTLTPRWHESAAWHSWIAEQLKETAERLDAALVFVPCTLEHDDDRVEHHAVAERIRELAPDITIVEVREHLGPREIAAIYERAALVVGMRLHACVMAYGGQTPFVAVAYHPKLHGFAQTVDASQFVLPKGVREQSASSYGYRFEETGLADEALAPLAERALREFSFEALPKLQSATRAAFERFCR